MKLIFESLNDCEMSRLELATISEGFKDSFEKGKKWVFEQIKKFIKFIKKFINTYIRRIHKGTDVESLDISKLKKPKDIIDKLGEESKEMDTAEKMVKSVLKMSTNYTVDDNLKVRDNIIKGFGMKQMSVKEIEHNMKTIERHLVDISHIAEKDNSVAVKSLLSIYNTILSIISESVKKTSSKNTESSYKDLESFMQVVKDNDVFAIKSDLEGMIVYFKADKKKCDDGIEYARKNSDFDWEEDDGVFFGEGLKTDSDKYYYEKERLVQNFTKERYLKVLDLYKKYDSEQSKKESEEAKAKIMNRG